MVTISTIINTEHDDYISGITYTYLKRTYHILGRTWAFYGFRNNIGTIRHIFFKTRTDETSWGSETVIRQGDIGAFDVKIEGNNIEYAYGNVGESGIKYRKGTLNSDGTITWLANEQTISTIGNFPYTPSINLDKNGYAWISYQESGSHYPYVIKNKNKDGTWETEDGFPFVLTTDAPNYWWHTIMLSLTGSKMYVVYSYTNRTVRGRLWNGTSFGDEEICSSSIIDYIRGGVHAISNNDDVYISFTSSVQSFIFIKRTYGVGWGEEVTIESGLESKSRSIILLDSINNYLYCFWICNTNNYPIGAIHNHAYYKISTNYGDTWGNEIDVGLLTDETENLHDDSCEFSLAFDNYDGYLYIIYVTDEISTNYLIIKCATISIPNAIWWINKSSSPYANGNKEYSIDGINWNTDTPDFNFELYGIDEDIVFRAYVGALGEYDSGDVIIGDYDGDSGLLWDQSEGLLKIKGNIESGSIDADNLTITNITFANFKSGQYTEATGDRSIPESTTVSASVVAVTGGPTNWTTIITAYAFATNTEEAWIDVSTLCNDASETSTYHISIRLKDSASNTYYPSSGGIASHIRINYAPQMFSLPIPANVAGKTYEVQLAILEEVTLTFESYATQRAIARHTHNLT